LKCLSETSRRRSVLLWGFVWFSFKVRPNTALRKEYEPTYNTTYIIHCIGLWIHVLIIPHEKIVLKVGKHLATLYIKFWLSKNNIKLRNTLYSKKAGRFEWNCMVHEKSNLIFTEIIFYSLILVFSVTFCIYVSPLQLSKDKNGVGKIEKKNCADSSLSLIDVFVRNSLFWCFLRPRRFWAENIFSYQIVGPLILTL
jgi:hypothetical protein